MHTHGNRADAPYRFRFLAGLAVLDWALPCRFGALERMTGARRLDYMKRDESVETYYSDSELGRAILDALAEMGKDANSLTIDDLAPIDAFHIRGRVATAELAGIANIAAGANILDVGSGLGGSARFLASQFDCDVTGLDITRDYCDVATMLSDLVGLGDSTRFEHGSALDMPFESDVFDVVWTEHAQMNIEDKRGFYSEITRVLKPGGKLAFHDIFQGPQGVVSFPVPWAGGQSLSFLTSEADLQSLLGEFGFNVLAWKDVTEASAKFFENRIPVMERRAPPPLDLALVMGADRMSKFRNLGHAVANGHAAVILAVMELTA